MASTPPEPPRYLPKQMIADRQVYDFVDAFAIHSVGPAPASVGDEGEGKLPSYESFVEDYRKLKMLAAKVNFQVAGFKKLYLDRLIPNLNTAYDRIETETGFHRLSDPPTNWIVNSGFRLWNSGVTLPLGWTATNAPNITRVAARAGAMVGNYAAQLVSGGSAGSISRTVKLKSGAENVLALAGWVYIAGANDSVTITLTDNGATPVVKSLTLTAAEIGEDAWFGFPRFGFSELTIQTADDATTLTLKLEVSANGTARFSDFHMGPGPQRDPDMWDRAPEDIEEIVGMGTLPTGYGSNGQVATTNGSGTVTWETPSSGGGATVVIKSANENVSSSTTLQDDDALLVAIGASESWSATFTIKAGQALGSATGIKVAITVPTGASLLVTATMTDTAGGCRTLFASSSGTACDFTTAMFAANDASITITANVVNGVNTGNIQLQWAQSTSSGTQLTVYAGSSVVANEV